MSPFSWLPSNRVPSQRWNARRRCKPAVEELEGRAVPSGLPSPDHIVVVVEENKAYGQIVGSTSAPYINSLINGPNAALFTNSFALTHPSLPDYLQLFSGSDQGVTNDNPPMPFSTPNLGAELLGSGRTFASYAESMPSVGYTGMSSGNYVRRHVPSVFWQGGATNGIPAADNQPFTSFPTDLSTLPTVAYVIPNLVNDMHNGPVAQGDAWLQRNLGGYVQWAQSHNSLLVVTFDEDDSSMSNQIPTLFYGAHVKTGSYSERITHYTMLRTLESLYGLACTGSSCSVSAISDIWN